jgi:EAL domain-containing protein (putative c-di-GMP-specific phosphodiesterase class I)
MSADRLLILDGDAAIANIISAQAETLGFKVKAFDDSKLFIDAFNVWQPSHLAIDLTMPTTDAIGLLASLVKLNCDARIILSDGSDAPVLSTARLIATEKKLNIVGIVPRPIQQQVLKDFLSTPTLEKLDTVPAKILAEEVALAKEPFIADEAAINHALQNNQFTVYYQPQIDLPSGRVFGLEGLVRWCHPTFGVTLPEMFIPIAEKTGQIDQLMQLVITNAFAFIRKLGPDLTFSLNISAKNIHDNRLVDTLAKSCDEFDIDPQRVILEFSDSAALMEPAETEDTLQQLRTKGFRIGIDDFGAGYSSVDQLAELPFSELKIDKSLVTTMTSSSKSRKVIASAINLADTLGLSTIAKGVENSMAAIGLRELGCKLGQGYYFAKPMNQDETLLWLNDWNHQLQS